MSRRIYRFMSFENFVDIVQKQALTLVHHSMWEDPYEGFIFRAWGNPIYQEKIDQYLLSKYPNIDLASIEAMLTIHYEITHGQSWSYNPESDAMWRIYGFNQRAVRVEIDSADVERLEPTDSRPTVFEIIYTDNLCLEDELNKIVPKHNQVKPGEPVLRKRREFEYEKEVRILSFSHHYAERREPLRPDFKIAFEQLGKRQFEEGKISREDYERFLNNLENKEPINKEIALLSFSHIPGFIKSVLVHPQAPEWYVETIREYCKKNDMPFNGKSTLYTFI